MDLNILTDEMIKEAIQKDAHSSFGDHIAGIVLVIILGIVLLKFFGGNLLDCIYFKDKKPIIYYIIHILLISFGVFLLVFSSNEISFLIHMIIIIIIMSYKPQSKILNGLTMTMMKATIFLLKV